MIGYNTLQKSMNGVKVLTDGVSFISDGSAQHQSIIYDDYIKSSDEKTVMTTDTVTTEDINCITLDCDDFSAGTVDATSMQTDYLKVINASLGSKMFEVDGLAYNRITAMVELFMQNTLRLENAELNQTQGGRIYQQGTNNNYFKDSYINGYLSVGSNITQSGGSSSLKDLTVDTLTMRENKGISQM